MAQPRNPHSPSPSPGGEDDFSLDDIEERQQQRPRLPEVRKEKQPFEAAAPSGPATPPAPERATIAPEDASAGRGWEPVAHEEIANYDPSPAGGDESSTERAPAASGREERAKARLQPTEGLDDLEEFIARATSQGPQSDQPARKRRPFTMLEKICSGAGAFVLILLAVWLFRAVASEANGIAPASEPWPDLPMKGELISISEASTSWRPRRDSDRVAQMEVIMPVPGLQNPDLVPQVEFTIDAAATKSGFLRFIFRDSYGKPRGDTRVVQVENGKLKSMDRGEIVKADTEGSVYCSEGMLSIHAYSSYKAEDVQRWSVEIAESSSYSAPDKDWKVLGAFDVRDELKE